MPALFSPIKLLTLSSIAFLLMACSPTEDAIIEERIRPVRTVIASLAPEDIKRRFAASSQAASTSKISFRVAGIVSEFPALAGSILKKGDLIAQLDSNDFESKLAQESAQYDRISVDLANSKSRFKRIESLFKKDLISEVDYDNARTEFLIDKAEQQQSLRSVELSRDQLSYTKLTSPADGCSVTDALADENENVSASQTIAIISCGMIMEVVSSVPESVVGRVSIGQQVEVLFNTIKDKRYQAEVTEIGISSSSNGVDLVTARINESDPELRPGMAAELVLTRKFESNNHHVWVPMVAIGKANGQHFAMIYEPTDDNVGVVKKVDIEIGRFAFKTIEVTKGITENQQVITAGLSLISDGLKVKRLTQESASK